MEWNWYTKSAIVIPCIDWVVAMWALMISSQSEALRLIQASFNNSNTLVCWIAPAPAVYLVLLELLIGFMQNEFSQSQPRKLKRLYSWSSEIFQIPVPQQTCEQSVSSHWNELMGKYSCNKLQKKTLDIPPCNYTLNADIYIHLIAGHTKITVWITLLQAPHYIVDR